MAGVGAEGSVGALVEACLSQRSPAAPAGTEHDPLILALVDAVRRSDARFAYEHEGRPAAIDAVREALPQVERELLDAVVDDHACEVAALREVLVLLVRRARETAA